MIRRGSSTTFELPFIMRVDRPFVFLIRERTSGAVLFMGKILDPS
jgi:serpin B